MKSLRTAGAGAACFILAFAAAPSQAQTVTPEMFGALPEVGDMAISPDGKTVAALQSVGGMTGVLFYDFEDLSARPTGARVGSIKARSIEWANNDRLLLLGSVADRVRLVGGMETLEFFRWISISRTEGAIKVLFENEGNFYITESGAVLATETGEPDTVVFSRWGAIADTNNRATRLGDEPGGALNVIRANVRTGSERRIETGTPQTRAWIVDRTGAPTLRIDYNPGAGERRVLRKSGAGFTEILSLEEERGAGSTIGALGLTPDGTGFYATVYGAAGRRSLVEIDLQTGESRRTHFEDGRYDIDSVIYDPRKATAIGVRYIDDMPRIRYLDPKTQSLQKQLASAIEGAAPIIVSQSADGTRAVVRAVYNDHPDQYFLYDGPNRRLDMFAPTYPKIDGAVYARKEKFDYVASDGMTIPGYLTVPANAAPGPLPLIVLPHGGPEGRDDMTFDWWAFFYAARGYLVYQPNFRGSDGYGYDFRAAGYGEWGRRMQDDVTEGVRTLVADGRAEAGRICIVGASYGGYAALVGATLTPGLYACAVSVNGVSNLVAMLAAEEKSSELASDYWTVRIGSRFRDAAALEAVSPAKNADKADAPILLIHGRDDSVVPFSQSRQMADALKSAKKPHELVTLDGEDHWLSGAATRTEMLARSIAFIDAHIGVKN